MVERRKSFALLSAAAAAACLARGAFAIDLPEVLPAALDQPQINAIVFVGDETVPRFGQTLVFDPNDIFSISYDNTFNIQAYLDTGASGILISDTTGTLLNIPRESVDGQSVLYYDVGVAGSDAFNVSQPIHLALANFYTRTDLDQFTDGAHTLPDITPYTPLAVDPNHPLQAQVGPVSQLSVADPVTDDISELIAELNALDVVGMPAIQGHVMVLDPTRVNNIHTLFDGGLDLDTIDELPDFSMRTYLYAPGTPFHANTQDTDPGIPATQLHIRLSYASFDAFTQVTQGGTGPTLAHNPFIGKDPVALLKGLPTPDVPGITITRGSKSSEGNWLLDTGAAASIISKAQAAAVGVHYADNIDPDAPPVLVDDNGVPLDDQFTLDIGGIGGQTTVAGFYLDSLLVHTIEGSATDDANPFNLNFTRAPVLVSDITISDPTTGQLLTLDGVFGMNYLVASADISSGDLVPTLNAFSTGYFNWVTFDEPNGILGLSFDPASGIVVDVPEPASLWLVPAAMLLLLRRKRPAV